MRVALLAGLLVATTARAQAPAESTDAAAATTPATPTAPSAADALGARVDDLARQLGDAQARIDRQAAELAALKATFTARDAHAAAFRVGRFSVALFGFLQADGILYHQASVDELNPSTGQPLNETRFLIRRARLRVEGDYGPVAGVIEFDGNTVNGPVARLIDVEASACWPRCTSDTGPVVMGTLGLMRIPFGFEVQERDYVRLFLERSNIARALFPGEFDLGARLQGRWRWLRWQVAAMNGQPSGDKQFALADPSASKDFLGRIGADSALGGRLSVAGGISALYGTGFHRGTSSTKDSVVWRDSNGDGQVDPTELVGLPGQPATGSQTFSRYAFGGDLSVIVELPRVGALTLRGELIWAANLDRALLVADPVAVGRDLRELGWYIAATQQLTRYCAVGVRYDRYDPDADAREQVGARLVPRDKTFSTLAVAIAAAFPPYARLTLEWDHNTNALARSDSGAPATLGSDVVTLRAQVVF
ncbi:MAG: phosphate-selective porin [Myxococcales bacterium]|nr:phosphate-selective porin [Myxococcales bacterium]